MSFSIPQSYYSALARVESSNNPLAKAATSSASGLFQFVKGTWEDLGGVWGSNPALPFGGANPGIDLQTAYADQLTQQNAQTLYNAGVPVTGNTLYAAHFLGADQAINVYSTTGATPLSQVISPSAIKANSFLANMNVTEFINWIAKKGGGAFNNTDSFRRGPSNFARVAKQT